MSHGHSSNSYSDFTNDSGYYGGGDYDWRMYAPKNNSYGPQYYGAYDNTSVGNSDDADYSYGRSLPPRRGMRGPGRYARWYEDFDNDNGYPQGGRRRNKTLDFLKNIAGSVLVAVIAGLIIRSIERSVVRYKEKKLAEKEKIAQITDETLEKYFPTA